MSLELLALIISLVVAIGSFTWNLVQARDTVKGREFDMLIKTLDTLEKRLQCTEDDLERAEAEIAELKAENAELRGRVAELEAENAELKRAREASDGQDRGNL